MIEREPAFKWVMRQELERLKTTVDNPVLMDIGANTGDYTILMGKYFDGTPHQIIAIEPEPQTYDLLCKSTEFYGINCIYDGHAISDGNQDALFYTSDRNNLCSLIHREEISGDPIGVECHTIPKILKNHDLDKVDFIKMDIEGGEVLALRGAREFLTNGNNPSILMEVHPHLYTEELSLEKELRFLFDEGWHCQWMISSAVPNFISGYRECLPARSYEVKPGWRRIIFYAPEKDIVIRYACRLHEIGIPTWHGTLDGKLIRALLLRK